MNMYCMVRRFSFSLLFYVFLISVFLRESSLCLCGRLSEKYRNQENVKEKTETTYGLLFVVNVLHY